MSAGSDGNTHACLRCGQDALQLPAASGRITGAMFPEGLQILTALKTVRSRAYEKDMSGVFFVL